MSTNNSAAEAVDDGTGIPPGILADEQDGGKGKANGEAGGAEEAFARRLGWKSQDEFKPRREGQQWIGADEFIKNVERETPLLRERLRHLDETVQKQHREISDYKKREEEGWGELVQRTRGAEVRGFEFARNQVKERMKQAVADANTQAYEQAERDLEELDKLRPAVKEPEGKKPADARQPAAQADPVVESWVNQNPWFTTDKTLHRVAKTIEGGLAVDHPELSTAERLQKTKEEIQRRYPEKFENLARKQPGAVAQPSAQVARQQKKDKTEADLPPEDRAVMERLVRQKVLTKAQYLKDYKFPTA